VRSSIVPRMPQEYVRALWSAAKQMSHTSSQKQPQSCMERSSNRNHENAKAGPSLRSATVFLVKSILGGQRAKSGLWKRWKTIELFPIFPTTPATTATGQLDFSKSNDDGPGWTAAARRCLTSRALALSRTSSLWARAMRMTLGGLPASLSRCWKAMKSGS